MVVTVSRLPKLRSCGFHHDDPVVFAQSQWQIGPKSLMFLYFQWIIALYFIGIVVASWTQSILKGNFAFWFIYLTDWGIMFCMVATCFGAVLTTLYHFDWMNLNSQSMSYKIYWFLSNVSTVLAFMITIVYWTLLFEGKTGVIDILIHGGNSVAMFLTLLVVRHPIYIFHFVYTINVGIVYVLFSIFYFFSGGVDALGQSFIYNILDWGKNPVNSAIVALSTAFLGILLHFFICLVQTLRTKIQKKYFARESLSINRQQKV